MPENRTPRTETTQLLLGIAGLLHRVGEVTDAADPLSTDAEIACHAVVLRSLALTGVPDGPLPPAAPVLVDDPAQLLRAALELALRLPVDPVEPSLSADLLVGLSDLHLQTVP